MERRLTAIFALDMVGYARLMELDEADTLARQETVFTHLIHPAIKRHHGRLVKEMGDGLLAEFASAVDAVECAAEIQRGMAGREPEVAAERRIEFRIGINVGDIIARDGDIFGDGVVVATRIESLADPGGVLVSESGFGQVQNKVDLGFEDLGPHSFKNLERPVRVYRVLLDREAAGTAPRPARRRYRRGLAALLVVAAITAAWQLLPRFTPGEELPSIAVLPFVNMSSDPEQGYFSEGISEELLNLLGKIPELRVAARTSSFAFKGRNLDIQEIARRLNVDHVLEGSVRKSGNLVRVTAQLIRGDDGFHVWSHEWDRTLDDIFQIQDEIASDVVTQLKITLLRDLPTTEETNPEAYALYLQARQMSRQRTLEALGRSVELYRQVLAIDPEYATGWAGLAGTYAYQAGAFVLPFDEGYMLAHEAANRALAIDPENAEAHAYLGYVAMYGEGRLVAAARHYERALELEPTNPDILGLAARLSRNLGRADDDIRLMEYVVELDPVNPTNYMDLGREYRCAGRLDESIASIRTALSLSPGLAGAQYAIGMALLLRGEPEEALEAMLLESAEFYRLAGLAMTYHAQGQAAESDDALAELIAKYEQGWAFQIAYVLAFRNEADRAFEWLDRAVEYDDPGLAEIPTQSLFSNIQGDPRWLPFLESIGKSPEQLAAVDFEVRLPQ